MSFIVRRTYREPRLVKIVCVETGISTFQIHCSPFSTLELISAFIRGQRRDDRRRLKKFSRARGTENRTAAGSCFPVSPARGSRVSDRISKFAVGERRAPRNSANSVASRFSQFGVASEKKNNANPPGTRTRRGSHISVRGRRTPPMFVESRLRAGRSSGRAAWFSERPRGGEKRDSARWKRNAIRRE